MTPAGNKAKRISLEIQECVDIINFWRIWFYGTRRLVVRDLLSETKGFLFESGC